MVTGDIKSKIDKLWETFWSGGIANPLTVIEQISYLLFIKRLDDLQIAKELKANRTKKPIENPIFTPEQDHLRWSKFQDTDAESMYSLVLTEVFPFIKNLGDWTSASYSKYMKDAIFMIQKPSLLAEAVDMINGIQMEDRDTKGDLYEYLLSKIATAGVNGQFRTPRHIIKMMVELTKPTPKDTICDPACGSAGFLVAAGEYLRDNHPEIFTNSELKQHFNEEMFHGFDFDTSMLRIGSMNMMLHGVENPNIDYKDSLSEANAQEEEIYSLVLANPPFKGSIDKKSIAKNLLSEVETTKTELLFPILMLRLLKAGGRCAVIVPDGVLFGASNAHKKVRQILVDNHKLEAVISMPSGVFKPYAGVSTGILIFTKTNSGGTDKVWFYDMQADGLSLDDKRQEVQDNDIPDLIEKFHIRHSKQSEESDRKAKSFFVPKKEIINNSYDLSINKYKEIEYEEVQYSPPYEILKEVTTLEAEIQRGLKELEAIIC